MIRNYFKISWRHIRSSKSYSVISIVGLAIGICCSLFIALYVFDELSYDQFHDKKDRIYRIMELVNHNGEMNAALTSLPVGPAFARDYPVVESFVRFMPIGKRLTVKVDEKVFREEKFWYTDSTIFEVMSFKLLQGDRQKALSAPHSVVLSKELAEKYFDNPVEAMGKSVQLGNTIFTVTGVVENSPSNSDITYNALASISSLPVQMQMTFNQDWFRLCCYTFLLFDGPVEEGAFREEMDDFSRRYVDPFVATFGESSSAEFNLQPLPNLHFDNSREYDTAKGNKSYISIFVLLAVFILAIACINYVNLSLSQSIKRAREVGVRKTLGARPSQIKFQFLGESVLISLIALFIGLVMVEVLLTPFNNITAKDFTFGEVFNWRMITTMLGIILITGIVSGIYPAIVLAGFDASHILRGSLPKLGKFGNLRRVLMVVQFAFSLFMIIGTISIFQQMSYLQQKELGFDRDQVVVVSLPQDTALINRMDYFKDELEASPYIKGVTGSGGIPGAPVGEIMFRIEQDGQMVDKNIKFLTADASFFDLLDIEVVEGRNFSEDIQSDVQQGFIVNETAARKFGWTDGAVEKRMQWGLLEDGKAVYDGKVVGVVSDFNFASLHNPLEPLVLIFRPKATQLLSVKLAGGDVENGLAYVEDKWAEFGGNHPFEYQFLDERIEEQYEEEKTLLTIFGYFSALSILIAALGLFALTSFTVQQRMKEFSVRKVLGARVSDLGSLLSREFVILLGVALVLISPVAYYAIATWLENFSYRINVPLYSFLLAVVLTLLITMATIGYHILWLARANPARTLRME